MAFEREFGRERAGLPGNKEGLLEGEEGDIAGSGEECPTASDCSICLTPLNQYPKTSSGSLDCCRRLLRPRNPKTFFKTPCNHRFHKECLLRWIEQKRECPMCRSVLVVK